MVTLHSDALGNAMLSQIRTLESRVQAVSDRTRTTGVVFHRLAFASEADFGYWYLSNNPQGEGPSAFVDIISIWAFGSAESGTTEWLVDIPVAIGWLQGLP